MIYTSRKKTGFRLTKFKSSLDADLSFNDKNCIAFRGIDERLECGELVGKWERDEEFSISAWFRTKAAYLAIGRGIWERSTPGQVTPGIYYFATSQGPDLWLQGAVFGTEELDVRGTYPNLGNESWHHMLVTYDGSSTAAGVKHWVDGDLLSNIIITDTLISSIDGPNSEAFIAKLNGTRGQIRQVSLWKRELVQLEIEQLYGNGNPPDIRELSFYEAACEAWWRMGALPHDVFPNILDWGPNEYNAEMINAEPEDIQPIDTPID